VYELITGYTKIAHKRRPEAMNADVYHPVYYKETDNTLQEIHYLLDVADELYNVVDKNNLPAYFSLVYYPVVGNLNLQKMWLLNGKNHYYAKFGYMEANKLIDEIKECLQRDKELIEEYHTIDNGKWYGMGLSEHMGFTCWNEDESQKPVLMNVLPANKPRLSVALDGTEQHCEGGWDHHSLFMNDFLRPDVDEASFTIFSISDKLAEYTISCDNKWLKCSKEKGALDGINNTFEVIKVKIDRNLQNGETDGKIVIKMPCGTCTIFVKASLPDVKGLPDRTFIETNGYISIEAEHFYQKKDFVNDKGELCRFEIIHGYGKTLSAVKAFPTTAYYTAGKDAPYLEYYFTVKETGIYEVELYMQPSNAVTNENTLFYGIQVNDDDIATVNAIPEGQRVNSHFWAAGVLENIHKQSVKIHCHEGLNTLKVYAVSPGFVLEKLVIYKEGNKPAPSYLGPTETYYLVKAD
ncbi:MAG TPA: alpha-glucuronidase, partial [Oscillospiraceae bacterium]|nr:alpha-glucuronidase [Oscillospiraceae bacterium]